MYTETQVTSDAAVIGQDELVSTSTDYTNLFNPETDESIVKTMLDPSTIVRKEDKNIRGKVDKGYVESLAWSIYINGYRDDRPLWVGRIDNENYVIAGHHRHAALSLIKKDKETFPDEAKRDALKKIPCLLKADMNWDLWHRLMVESNFEHQAAFNSDVGRSMTQGQFRDGCVKLLTYPDYWVLTDTELAKVWKVNHATVNRWRKRARKLLNSANGDISQKRKDRMRDIIASRQRVLQDTDEDGNRIIRQLSGDEPSLIEPRKAEEPKPEESDDTDESEESEDKKVIHRAQADPKPEESDESEESNIPDSDESVTDESVEVESDDSDEDLRQAQADRESAEDAEAESIAEQSESIAEDQPEAIDDSLESDDSELKPLNGDLDRAINASFTTEDGVEIAVIQQIQDTVARHAGVLMQYLKCRVTQHQAINDVEHEIDNLNSAISEMVGEIIAELDETETE